MNKNYFFLFFVIITFLGKNTIFAQQKLASVKLSTGFGYYNPNRMGETGNLLFSKLLFKLPTGFYVGGEFAGSLVFNTFDQNNLPSIRGKRTYDNYYMYSLHFEKPFFFGSNKEHELSISSGFIYIERKYSRIAFTNDSSDPNVLIPYIDTGNSNQNDGGTFIELNYNYYLSKVSIGLKVRSHILLELGFEELIVSPAIRIGL